MKRLLFFLPTFLFFAYGSYAQDLGGTETQEQNDTTFKKYTDVDQQAYFEGSLGQFLGEHLVYPKDARDAGLEGVVQVCFYVNEDGSTSNFVIAKSLSKSCDEEVIRVLQLMPRWKPAMKQGKPVKSHYTLPVSFKL